MNGGPGFFFEKQWRKYLYEEWGEEEVRKNEDKGEKVWAEGEEENI